MQRSVFIAPIGNPGKGEALLTGLSWEPQKTSGFALLWLCHFLLPACTELDRRTGNGTRETRAHPSSPSQLICENSHEKRLDATLT